MNAIFILCFCFFFFFLLFFFLLVTCELLLSDPQSRYLILPCSYASNLLSASSSSSSSSASFPFILSIYSASPVLIQRVSFSLPSLSLAHQLSILTQGEVRTLSPHC